MSNDFEIDMDETMPLRDEVFHNLRKAILTGELRPGERLMEVPLSKKLGVSRTPIREAIHMLVEENLVVMVPRKGAQVAQISENSMRDVLEIRRALDALCTQLACDRITEDGIIELKKACLEFEEQTKQDDIRELAKADVNFHEIILQATKNQRLIQLVHNLSEQMYRYRFVYLQERNQYERLIVEHRIILEAIELRKREAAAEAAKLHIDNQESCVIRKIHQEQQNENV